MSEPTAERYWRNRHDIVEGLLLGSLAKTEELQKEVEDLRDWKKSALKVGGHNLEVASIEIDKLKAENEAMKEGIKEIQRLYSLNQGNRAFKKFEELLKSKEG